MSLSKRIFGVRGFESMNFKTASSARKRAFNQAKFGAVGKSKMISLVGDKQLVGALKALDLAIIKKVMRPAISQALTIANREAKRLAPKRSGQLRKSIGKKTKTHKQGVVGWIGIRQGYQHIVNGKNADPSRYAYYVEFGNGGNKSFLRKAMGNKRAEIDAKLNAVASVKFEIEAKKATIRARSL